MLQAYRLSHWFSERVTHPVVRMMSGTKVSGVTGDWQTEELAKGFPHLCRSKLVLCEDVDAVLRKL